MFKKSGFLWLGHAQNSFCLSGYLPPSAWWAVLRYGCLLGLILSLNACGGLSGHRSSSRPGSQTGPMAAPPAESSQIKPAKKGGAYYQDDGPGDQLPANLDAIPEPIPQVEPLARGANQPYNVLGQDYVPLTRLQPFQQRGMASWYGRKFHGQKTSNGEIYDMYGMTAAHPILPIPSYARVTRVATGRSLIVRVNDRGPFLSNRVIDLSFTAAHKLGLANAGSAEVIVEQLLPDEIARLQRERETAQTILVAYSAPSPTLKPELKPDLKSSTQSSAAKPALNKEKTQKSLALSSTNIASKTIPSAAVAAPAHLGNTDLGNPDNLVTPQSLPTASGLVAPASDSDNLLPTSTPAVVNDLPVVAAAQGFYLQLGAFSTRNNAEDFLAKLHLRLEGIDEPLNVVNTGRLFKLHLGPYQDGIQAALAAAQIHQCLEFRPLIVNP